MLSSFSGVAAWLCSLLMLVASLEGEWQGSHEMIILGSQKPTSECLVKL